jgi:phosphohistidine phosphatase SixA
MPSDALVKALRQGGNVIVMRHAASPRATPDQATANPDNTTRERQLDAAGRASAKAMGQALRDLKIPVGDVLVSPTYRARETAKLAEWTNAKPAPELGDGGQNMQESSDTATKWLQKQVTQFPSGTNTILITHSPNLTRAFPQQASGIADGEALVFGPDGNGGATLVARVKIDQWPSLPR